MIGSDILGSLFEDSYGMVMGAVEGVSHEVSVRRPVVGGNSVHWILGHVVVARCNFLMLLNVPSIWDWGTCKLFIPGSSPSDESAGYIGFEQLVVDLERTQELLLDALERSETADLERMHEDKRVGQHLAEYALHEAYHAGQMELLKEGEENN